MVFLGKEASMLFLYIGKKEGILKKSLFENERRGDFNLYEDWVFRYVFTKETEDSRKALMAILNVILNRRKDPIVDIEILNPHFLGEHENEKESVLDIRAKADSGELIDVEMQNKDFANYGNRVLIYGCRMVNSSLEKGQDYGKMVKSIVISFANGVLFSDIEDIHTVFHVRGDKHQKLLSDRLEFHFIELGKVDVNRSVEDLDAVELLAAYMRFAGDKTKEDYLQSIIEHGGDAVAMTEKIFNELTEDRRAYEIKESLFKAELDKHNWELQLARKAQEEGLAKGLAEGLAEGLEKGLAEGLEKGLAEGLEKGIAEGLEKGLAEGLSEGKIMGEINTCREFGLSEQEICRRLIEKYEMTEEEAKNLMENR